MEPFCFGFLWLTLLLACLKEQRQMQGHNYHKYIYRSVCEAMGWQWSPGNNSCSIELLLTEVNLLHVRPEQRSSRKFRVNMSPCQSTDDEGSGDVWVSKTALVCSIAEACIKLKVRLLWCYVCQVNTRSWSRVSAPYVVNILSLKRFNRSSCSMWDMIKKILLKR